MKALYITIPILLFSLSTNLFAKDSSWGDVVIKKAHVKKGFRRYHAPGPLKKYEEEEYGADWFLRDITVADKRKAAEKRLKAKRKIKNKVNKPTSKQKKRKRKKVTKKRWETQGWH